MNGDPRPASAAAMNRIQSLPLETDFDVHSLTEPELGLATVSVARGEAFYSLFAPLHYEPNYGYPLLVWLHGPDDDESQLKRIMPLVSMRNFVGVAPRGTTARRDTHRQQYAWRDAPADIAVAEQRVFESIAAAQRKFNIRPQRIFLGGFDCGGTMAFRLAMLHPDRFRGVMSLGGPFPTGSCLRRLHEARNMNVFICGGATSERYPASRVCDDLRLLHCAGMHITLRHYPCGHVITPDMLADMNRWMMELVTEAAVA
jgi:phospholipase/carboxylesterase